MVKDFPVWWPDRVVGHGTSLIYKGKRFVNVYKSDGRWKVVKPLDSVLPDLKVDTTMFGTLKEARDYAMGLFLNYYI